MSDLIRKNYKMILIIGIFLLLLPIIPTLVEMVFKVGTYVGTWIRLIGTNGICL